MPALLIADGYTLDGKVKRQGPWPEVSFRYRPALPEDVYEYFKAPKNSGKEQLRAVLQLLAKHLVSWDVTDEKDNPVVLSPESLKRVPQFYLDRMVDHVCGYGPEEQGADLKN